MNYVFEPPAIVGIPVLGRSEQFPVHRVYCVGQNYAEHAREMGSDPDREPPFFFCKPADAIVPLTGSGRIPYPTATAELHHEIELVVVLAAGGRDLDAAAARDSVFGHAVGVDLTRRDLQTALRREGRPWDVAKGFDRSAPLTPIRPLAGATAPDSGRIWLDVNGSPRQRGDLQQLIWKVPEIIATLSGLFELRAGDVIFTGTPSGIGSLQRGDRVQGGVDGVGELSFEIG